MENVVIKKWVWCEHEFSLSEDYQSIERFGVYQFHLRRVDGGILDMPSTKPSTEIGTIIHMNRRPEDITLDMVFGRFLNRKRRTNSTSPLLVYLSNLYRQGRIEIILDIIY